ncbi:MAG TPA: hypothetical protein VFR07_04475 [Mycobacteriales bacterium]|jgi:hypothetical protein|nr:hypothetical protein [Mycobacteriales bacterium]
MTSTVHRPARTAPPRGVTEPLVVAAPPASPTRDGAGWVMYALPAVRAAWAHRQATDALWAWSDALAAARDAYDEAETIAALASGVFLPVGKEARRQVGTTAASHGGVHSNRYHTRVFETLSPVQTREQALEALSTWLSRGAAYP